MKTSQILACVLILACTVPIINARPHSAWRRFLMQLQQNGNNGNGIIIVAPGNNNGTDINDSTTNGTTSDSQNEILPKIQNMNLNNANGNGNPSVIYLSDVPTKPPVTPERIQQINNGVSTILGGVGSGSLENILRGSFMFTRNENVRTVANNVLDSIFGTFRRRT